MRVQQHYSPIIFFYAENPSAEYVVGYVKLVYEVGLLEHGYGNLAGLVVGVLKVDELEAHEIVLFGLYLVGHELERIVVASRRMVAQTFQGDFLLRHELASRLVHLSIVDTQTAKNCKSLEYCDVRVREGKAVVLIYQLGHPDYLTLTIDDWHAQDTPSWLRTHLRSIVYTSIGLL